MFYLASTAVSKDTVIYSYWVPDSSYQINGMTLFDSGSKEIAAIPESIFTVSVSVNVSENPGADYFVRLAAYDANGRLADICCKRCSTDGGASADISFTLDGQADRISSLKTMMITGLGLPITAAVSIS